MANERSLAVGVSFLGYGDPGDGVPASIYTSVRSFMKAQLLSISMKRPLSIFVRKG